jgi:tetratricopeptide (TPR) repeat protein
MGDSENTGILLGKLAAIYMDQHDYRAATIALSEAIALFEQAQRLDLMGRSLGNLGTALGHLGRWHEAGQRHAAALRIARRLEDVEEERFQLQNLAFVAEAEGQLRWAITYGRQALYLALLEDDEPAVAELTFDLGRLLMNDPEAIGQAVILLHRSAELNPQPEVQQLLRDAKIRLRRREQAGRHIAEVEPDLLVYAGEAYQKS